MILADSSVWVDHLRHGEERLAELLVEKQVLIHPFVVGETACGNRRHRVSILGDLQDLPTAILAGHEEALRLVEERHLWGRGIGWVDAHCWHRP